MLGGRQDGQSHLSEHLPQHRAAADQSPGAGWLWPQTRHRTSPDGQQRNLQASQDESAPEQAPSAGFALGLQAPGVFCGVHAAFVS